jgi:hypothetical protein
MAFQGKKKMTCSEFQRVLPEIIETGGNEQQEAHLDSCAVCSDLVRDLRYIAEVAKLLVPMEDPDPRVWDGIQKSLEKEGLIKRKHLTRLAARMSARFSMLVFSVLALEVAKRIVS